MEQSPKRILLAEDEYLVRLLVKDELENSGFVILEAGHGLDAIAMFDDPDHVDLLVTNVSMPGADGIDVATAARKRHPNIPIIFINATPERLTSARTPIPHHLMSRPFDTDNLVRLVRTLLHPG
jgi:CheY-like chemotaxis protein